MLTHVDTFTNWLFHVFSELRPACDENAVLFPVVDQKRGETPHIFCHILHSHSGRMMLTYVNNL